MTESQHPRRHAREHDGTFRVLMVCTGNICRSPLAELLLRARLTAAFPPSAHALEIASAGTMALDGQAMQPASAHEALRLGVSGSVEHTARSLDRDLVEGADLIVGMAREHRSAVVRMVPRAHRRTFTLVELTRVVEGVAAGRLPIRPAPLADDQLAPFLHSVVEAAGVRGLAPMHERFGLDIEDPYGRTPAVYRRVADVMADHVDRLTIALTALAAGEGPVTGEFATQGAGTAPA